MSALSERLRAAATAERLSDWVIVQRDGLVYWRETTCHSDLFDFLAIRRGPSRTRRDQWQYSYGQFWQPLAGLPTREAAIRAGLIALAERLDQ